MTTETTDDVLDRHQMPERAKDIIRRLSADQGGERVDQIIKDIERVAQGLLDKHGTDGVEELNLDKFAIRKRAINELKKTSSSHVLALMKDQGILKLRFFAREPDNDDVLPFDLFCVQSVNDKLFSGELIHCSIHDEDRILFKTESFSGTALEVMVNDFEDDGFIEVTN